MVEEDESNWMTPIIRFIQEEELRRPPCTFLKRVPYTEDLF